MELNRNITRYSNHAKEQSAYEEMQNLSFKVAALLIEKGLGCYAEILGSSWFVASLNGKYEIFATPDSPGGRIGDVNCFIVSGFEGQGLWELNATIRALTKWLESPDYFYIEQNKLEDVVKANYGGTS